MIIIQIRTKSIDPDTVINGMDALHTEYTRKLIIAMVADVKARAPVRSGRLRNSIKSLGFEHATSGKLTRYHQISVGPSVSYAHYVSEGTGASNGVYVPVLDKRIKYGRHSGTDNNDYLKDAAYSVIIEARRLGLNIYSKWRKSWRPRSYRSGMPHGNLS